MKITSFLLLVLFLPLIGCGKIGLEGKGFETLLSSEMREDSILIWTNSKNLLVEDFWLENRPKNVPYNSYSKVCFNLSLEADSMPNNNLLVDIKAELFRAQSWLDTTMLLKDEILIFLDYKQACFDIYEVAARRVRKELSEMAVTEFNTQWFLIEMAMVEANFVLQNELLIQFQQETRSGKDATALRKWKAKIKNWLYNLEEFSETIVEVKCSS